MSKKSIILVVVFFVLLVAGMFVYAYMKRVEINNAPIVEEQKESPANDSYTQVVYKGEVPDDFELFIKS